MYAILNIAGKQHPVFAGDVFKISRPKISPYEEGSVVKFNDILLLVGDDSGKAMYNPGNKVAICKVLANIRDKKVYAFKKRRRKNSRRIRGHRQDVALLKFEGVE